MGSDIQLQFGHRFARPVVGMGWGTNKRQAIDNARASAWLRVAVNTSEAGTKSDDYFGWGIAPAGGGENAMLNALFRSAGDWLLDQVELGNAPILSLPQKRFGCLPELALFRKCDLKLYKAVIQLQPSLSGISSLIAVIATSASVENGIHLASGAALTEMDAVRAALRRIYLKRRLFENVCLGREQLLDQISYQRLWLLGISPSVGCEVTRKLLASSMTVADLPGQQGLRILDGRLLDGPWGSSYSVGKIEIAGFEPMANGGLERWVH